MQLITKSKLPLVLLLGVLGLVHSRHPIALQQPTAGPVARSARQLLQRSFSERIIPDQEKKGCYLVRAQQGDTIESIASNLQIPVDELKAANENNIEDFTAINGKFLSFCKAGKPVSASQGGAPAPPSATAAPPPLKKPSWVPTVKEAPAGAGCPFKAADIKAAELKGLAEACDATEPSKDVFCKSCSCANYAIGFRIFASRTANVPGGEAKAACASEVGHRVGAYFSSLGKARARLSECPDWTKFSREKMKELCG